jgi:glycosyltransferase involved in cell wall biosynthesis
VPEEFFSIGNYMARCKISIVTATYNSESDILKCLESVAKQTYIDSIEHIIIDGGSNDSTLDLVAMFPHVSLVISEKDRGIYHAFNKGLAVATGELIYYLGSDDYIFEHNTLAKVANLYSKDVDFISGRVVMEEPVSGRRWTHIGRDIIIKGKSYIHPAHQSFFIRTSALKDVYGGFPECFKIYADSYIMLRAISELNGIFTPEIIATYSVSGVSNNDEHSAQTQIESTLVYSLIGVESKNDIYSVSSANLKNYQSMKVLVRALLSNKRIDKFPDVEFKIFGVADLSLIMCQLLLKYNVKFTGFVTTYGEKHEINGFPVSSLNSIAGNEVIVNGVEGPHAEGITDLIKSKNKNVTVIGWKDFINEAFNLS